MGVECGNLLLVKEGIAFPDNTQGPSAQKKLAIPTGIPLRYDWISGSFFLFEPRFSSGWDYS
jgi:hypothetical protein